MLYTSFAIHSPAACTDQYVFRVFEARSISIAAIRGVKILSENEDMKLGQTISLCTYQLFFGSFVAEVSAILPSLNLQASFPLLSNW